MKSIHFVFGILTVSLLTAGCSTVYIRHHPTAVVTHTQTVIEQGYYQGYEDCYTGFVDINYHPVIWVGTTIIIGGIPCCWCDFCCLWHPRCTSYICYCHPVIVNHYGFYRFGHYYNYCYDWTYDRYYEPQISTYRFKSGGQSYSYTIEEKKREIVKRGSGEVETERVRYQGKNENRYTVDPEQIVIKRPANEQKSNDKNNNRTIPEKMKEQMNTEGQTIQKNIQKQTQEKTPPLDIQKPEVIKKTGNETGTEKTSIPNRTQIKERTDRNEKSTTSITNIFSEIFRSKPASSDKQTVEKPTKGSSSITIPGKAAAGKQDAGTTRSKTADKNTSSVNTKPVIKKIKK